MGFNLMHGDCLKMMQLIPDGSIDMVLADPPYGTTACKWDTVIPLEAMWAELKRVIKPKGAIVMTASQPFTSALVMSNPKMFKYCWVWEKSKASNFLLARKQPLKAHEDVLIFSLSVPEYYPQKTIGKPFKGEGRSKKGSQTELVNHVPNPTKRADNKGDRFPRSVQYFVTAEREGCLHPTQKPVALMEYLIRTYTNEGETVLDFTMGSGTTGVACANTGRKFIGIELDQGYFDIAKERIYGAISQSQEL
jgi:site-specific DNA-methyltransferase (adenine-specific)